MEPAAREPKSFATTYLLLAVVLLSVALTVSIVLAVGRDRQRHDEIRSLNGRIEFLRQREDWSQKWVAHLRTRLQGVDGRLTKLERRRTGQAGDAAPIGDAGP